MRAVLFALGFASVAAAARDCAAPPGFDAKQRAESAEFVVHYRADPSPVDVGQLFALDAVVCAKRDATVAQGLAVDATMPEHRHGMNYRPTVTAQGGGRYRVDGLMFHMPGRWQLVFDVDIGVRRERLAADLLVE